VEDAADMPALFKRRGASVIEAMVSLVILAAAAAAVVQLLAMTAGQRRAMEQRRIALQEVANQAERLAVAPWDETAAERLSAWQPTADLLAALPQAQCTATVGDEGEIPRSRRIDLKIQWSNAAGQEVEPVVLSVWKFARQEQP
jgi:type II secretory pathway pseudopilin PulG